MWAQVLPRIKVREDLVVRSAGHIGWAIRKESPQLKDAINDFYVNYVRKQGVAEYRLSQYMKRIKQISDNTGRPNACASSRRSPCSPSTASNTASIR